MSNRMKATCQFFFIVVNILAAYSLPYPCKALVLQTIASHLHSICFNFSLSETNYGTLSGIMTLLLIAHKTRECHETFVSRTLAMSRMRMANTEVNFILSFHIFPDSGIIT